MGTVGRIVAQKAPIDFVRMCARVMRVRPDVVFVMVGDTTLESSGLEEETRLEADRLGVRILFTGFRADAPRVAATFDVYVVPSRYEGLGRALTEAMASGRPVVASAVNGVPDLVEPGVTGLLTEAGDVEAMADSVLWLLDHPEEAAMMGSRRATASIPTSPPRRCAGPRRAVHRDPRTPGPARRADAADAGVEAPMDLVRRTA